MSEGGRKVKHGACTGNSAIMTRADRFREKPTMTDKIAAELFSNNTWRPIDLNAALNGPGTNRMRCPECHGRVRAHKAGTTGQKAHMEHFARHAGCPRGDCYDGAASLHPKALT